MSVSPEIYLSEAQPAVHASHRSDAWSERGPKRQRAACYLASVDSIENKIILRLYNILVVLRRSSALCDVFALCFTKLMWHWEALLFVMSRRI